MNSKPEIPILSFWHKLEFFEPYDAKGDIGQTQNKGAYSNFTDSTLEEIAKPHSNQSITHWLPKPAEGKELGKSKVYFHLFDTGCLSQSIQELLKEALSESEEFTLEAMKENNGITCYATLPINEKGECNLSEMEVSTAPWAVGFAMSNGLNKLNFEAFDADCKKLREDLETIGTQHLTRQQQNNAQAIRLMLSPALLLAISGCLKKWAYDYQPSKQEPKTGIRTYWRTAKSKPSSATASTDEESAADEIGILNSFYAQDIHSIIRQIQNGENSATLSAYVGATVNQSKTDLYGKQGNRIIWRQLRPKNWNKGRWLSEPVHGLSLMQQFAVNTFFQEHEQPVFSVNGPPGTGKTTLLRDIFAENIVRRAVALAKLDSAKSAFSGRLKVGTSTVWRLKPELTGFEMIVVSSNNAAVENISRDLPKKQSLGKAYCVNNQPSYSYLDKVARNLFTKGEEDYKTLSPEDDTWGLFSGALGRKSNRTMVQNGIFFERKEFENYDETLHNSIWTWRNNYQGRSFEEAKHEFQQQLEKVDKQLNELDRYFLLHEKMVLNADVNPADIKTKREMCEQACDEAKQECESSREHLAAIQALALNDVAVDKRFMQELMEAQTSLQDADRQLNTPAADHDTEQRAYWQNEIEALKYRAPNFFVRLLQRKKYKEYRERVAHCHEQLAQLHLKEDQRQKSLRQRRERCFQAVRSKEQALADEQKRVQQKQFTDAQSAYHVAQERLSRCQNELAEAQSEWAQWQTEWQTYQAYLRQFPHIRLPENYDDLNSDTFQIAGLWQDEKLNDARSRLFGCALQLHEAWLAEVCSQGGGFGSNLVMLSKFLNNEIVLDRTQTLVVWQSLFMLIPVISSTFASFARQFRDVGAGCLGYLFIDEAGQAVPQAAVGAIWRAQRVLAVGDPIQIEPVFTTPPPLVRALEKTAALPDQANVSPTDVSVQVLADQCNVFGANIIQGGDTTWIGSPLRVHRRCSDPMFSIANQIAYENKMIFGDINPAKRQPPKQGFHLGESSWVQIAGKATLRQFVQEQADLVIKMLIEIVQHTGNLPDLYIITPFKQIKTELSRQIRANSKLKALKGLRQWCDTRIGTVHTFQGKEEKMVWLVLGCDDKTQGAAQWAASKPNLLNVALTRAKHYVFVIGDKNIWADKTYFDVAAQRLPEIGNDTFLKKAQHLNKDEQNYSGLNLTQASNKAVDSTSIVKPLT